MARTDMKQLSRVLHRALSNMSQSMTDRYIEKNAQFRYEAGLSPKIIRTSSGHCCEWCNKIAGTYSYPDVPKDVYRRHDNCDCAVEYECGKKVTNVHTKEEKYVFEKKKHIVTDEEDNKNYKDVLKEWIKKGNGSVYKVEKSKSIVKNGIVYNVDGINVILDSSPREEEIANIINNTFGGKIKIMPRFTGKLRNMNSSDYLIDGIEWDLKEINGRGKDAVRDAIKRKSGQANNFILDITNSQHDINQLNWQIENIFSAFNTKFVDSIIVVKNDKVIRVVTRKK